MEATIAKAWALVILAGALACSCSPKPIAGCVVVEKRHSGQWVQFICTPVVKATMTQVIIHPERWLVVVRGRAANGECHTRSVYVSREQWDAVTVGQPWPDVGVDEERK